MHLKSFYIFFTAAVILVRLSDAESEGNYYSDVNREIFLSPRSAALAGSDIAVNRSALPLSSAAALPGDSVKELSIAYAGYFHNTYSTGALSFITPVDEYSSLGISASYILVPDIEIYDYGDTVVPLNVPTKTGSDFFFRMSYGRRLVRLGERAVLTAGASLNAERLNLVGWTGYGIGADVGFNLLYQTKNWGLATAGLLFENLTTTYTHWSIEYKDFAYPHLRIGIGWQKALEYLYGKLSVSYLSPDLFSNEGINEYGTDTLYEDRYVESPAIKRVATNPFMLFLSGKGGAEYTVMNTITFRLGMDFISGNFCFGGGVKFLSNRAGFDFAYLDHDLASTYKLSVLFNWQ